ncbi:hypothetical protein F5148DRAFT_1219731 [Russula earlei]|uniref:Uncharacterized protein n=1 Tax=Russula earlei TaxID=71964 RepID=A0ACC0U309_9AGAM|nr:hypothetical protein F5148DRAFT_1219731 [Russula earlei]
MSSTASSSANFQSVLNAAFESYTKKTGIDLINHPSAHKLENCNTSEDILQLFQERETAFKDYRNKNRKLINRLRPVVQVVHAFSGVISKVAGTVPFQPTKAIFVGVDILLVAAIRVSASYDALIDLFECILL